MATFAIATKRFSRNQCLLAIHWDSFNPQTADQIVQCICRTQSSSSHEHERCLDKNGCGEQTDRALAIA